MDKASPLGALHQLVEISAQARDSNVPREELVPVLQRIHRRHEPILRCFADWLGCNEAEAVDLAVARSAWNSVTTSCCWNPISNSPSSLKEQLASPEICPHARTASGSRA